MGAMARGVSSELGAAPPRLPGSAVDVFCGVGGLSRGFAEAGFNVRAGIDTDAPCRYAYERNNGARFIERSIESLAASDVNPLFAGGEPRIFMGCAPCQPFSTYNRNRTDAKWRLFAEFARLVRNVRPEAVSMKNVPRLTSFRNGELFEGFLTMLERHGHSVWWSVVDCADCGVPQSRKRLVVLASRLGDVERPPTGRLWQSPA